MTDYTKPLVGMILSRPHEFEWQVQGLGMMRLYLSEAVRLHVWDAALRVPGVSAIHSHPWDLVSTVVAGRYKQHRYVADGYGSRSLFNRAMIQCGVGAHVVEDSAPVELVEMTLETYEEGTVYRQTADEVHLSLPEDGTVTIIERTFHEDRDHAAVYWRGKGSWTDAAPRKATKDEIDGVTKRAIETWF